jgi:tetratricopeptide (TPR) repeat protein
VSLLALLFLILLIIELRSPGPEARLVPNLYRLEAQALRQGWTLETMLQAGDRWAQLGDLSRALPYWEAAAELPQAALRLAEAYLSLQRWPDAATSLENLLEESPDDPWLHYQLGLIRVAFDPRAAEPHLQLAAQSPQYQPVAANLLRVAGGPENSAALRAGLALAGAELWPYAELAFRHAADLGESFAVALAYVGLARDRQGKHGGPWIERALAVDSQDATVRYLEGLHLRQYGDLEGSRDALTLATALEPRNPAYYAELGSAYRLLGDMESAERWLRVAVDNANDDPRFSEMLALFYAEEITELDDESLELLAELADNADLQAVYAWTLYRLGDVDSAESRLNTLLEAVPDEPRALFYKAQILLDQGDPETALPLLEQVAAQESPVQTEAQRLLAALAGG